MEPRPGAPPAGEPHAGDLRFILGLKLKHLRRERGLSLKDVAARSAFSISYLSEIEQGKKYPKAEKLLVLARALGVAYEDLVSLRVSGDLDPLKAVFTSPLVREFPFDLYGLEPERLFSVIRGQPTKAGALLSALSSIGQTYDVEVEDFLFAALRSYQAMQGNYFEDLEREADRLREDAGLPDDAARDATATEAALRHHLETRYDYAIDTDTLAANPDLRGFRSVFKPGRAPKLYLNGTLRPVQRAFVLARELAYERLGLGERALTSTWLQVRSFDQLLNNLKASYFAGALLLGEAAMVEAIGAFFALPRWDEAALAGMTARFGVTPEMLFYRFSQLVPRHFGLRELFFMRLQHRPGPENRGTGVFDLTKVLNLSHVPLTLAMHLDEHRCRRWVASMLLGGPPAPGDGASGDAAGTGEPGDAAGLVARAQRSVFFERGETFLSFALARPLVLQPGVRSCVSFGVLLNDESRARVAFADDPAIPDVEVNLTCERCPLPLERCPQRGAPPTLLLDAAAQARKEAALATLGVPLAG